MPFALMDCQFGIDGLESESPILTDNDADVCFRRWAEIFHDPCCICRIVEVDATGQYVYEQLPYPRVKEPDFPDWFAKEMRSAA